jgi:hypothetical protein
VACGSNRYHRVSGKSGRTVHKQAMKWFFSVQMARSAAFARCIPGGAS